MRSDPRFLLVLGCFLLSGFAALLFQTAWTREFAFVFGTSDLAVATVLAAYMGGLAAGATVAGRFAPRLRRPVLVYGLLELGIGVAALLVPLAIRASRALSIVLFGGRESLPGEGALGLALFYLACSFAILLVPTALMGATLPLLARDAVRSDTELGTRVGALYATNTLGAVLGTLVSGFVLLPWLGLRHTVWAGAAVNAVVFALAASVARLGPAEALAEAAPSVADGDEPRAGGAPPRAEPRAGSRAWLVLPILLASGVASFTYEVLWTRLLGHVMGGSVYAFATMLASFLVGIAAGSALATRFTRDATQAARALAVTQIGVALTAVAAYFALDALPVALAALGAKGMQTPLHGALGAACILVPSTLFIGATFPLGVRVLAGGARGGAVASRASARVYSWNTAGAILGAIGAGFFVVPALGYASSLVAAVGLNLALALAATRLAPEAPRMRGILAAASVGLVALALVPLSEPWNILSVTPFSRRVGGEVTYFGVGRSSTVLLTRWRGSWSLRTNGLPEAGILPRGQRSFHASEEALTALPVVARPDATSLLVVGFGGGTAIETVSPAIRTIDVIDLEPEVIAANRAISGQRARDPLADPRVRVHLGDARGALLLTEQRWDLVVSQPSHPWTAGASHLYTREFFELARDHLRPGGAFLQWIGPQFVDEALLRTLVATLCEAFPHVVVFSPPPSRQILFLASDAPLDPVASAARALSAAPGLFAQLGLRSAEDVAIALWLDAESARRFAAGAPASTDDQNLLQTRSPRVLRRGYDQELAQSLHAAYDTLPERARSLDRLYVVRRLLASEEPVRAERVAQRISDGDERSVARAIIALSTWRPRAASDAAGGGIAGFGDAEAGEAGDATDAVEPVRPSTPESDARRARATAQLEEVLARRPELVEARWALLRERRADWIAARPEAVALAAPLRDPELAVLEGWRLEAQGDETGVRALEPRLASAGPRDPAFGEAMRLRALWRVATQEPPRALEAIELIDETSQPAMPAERLLVKARAALVAGYPWAAADALMKLSNRLGGSADGRALAQAAHELLGRIPEDPSTTEQRRFVTQRLAPYLRS
jgi:spermidine synthase